MSVAPNHPQLLRIGELARLTDKTVRAIHLYEELDLLKPATRSSGGFRLYEQTAVDRVRWIDLLHAMGFSLQEMRDVLRAWWGAGVGSEAMKNLRSLFHGKLEETRSNVRRYQELEGELQRGLEYLETCRECATPETSVRRCVDCSQDHGMSKEPALVAGIVSASGRSAKTARKKLIRLETNVGKEDEG